MSGLVEYSHPNFIAPIEVTTDPLYGNQYYLNNTGQSGGTPGIDIDARVLGVLQKVALM